MKKGSYVGMRTPGRREGAKGWERRRHATPSVKEEPSTTGRLGGRLKKRDRDGEIENSCAHLWGGFKEP